MLRSSLVLPELPSTIRIRLVRRTSAAMGSSVSGGQ
jgi:hypothetical protein